MSLQIPKMRLNIVVYSWIQVLTSVITLVGQYIFVTKTYYEHFTIMHAPTNWGTLVLRMLFGSSLFVSGFFGVIAYYKKSPISIWTALVCAGISCCICLVFLGESAICTTYVVTKMEQNTRANPYPLEKSNVLNINIEIGEDSSRINLPMYDAKLLLSLFSTQLIVCLIQTVTLIFSISGLNHNLKETTESRLYFAMKDEISCKEIHTTAI